MKLTTTKLKQLIKEELSEMMHDQQRFDHAGNPATPYRFKDEEAVDKIYGSSEFKDHGAHKTAIEDLLGMLGISQSKLEDLKNRLEGMRLDAKGQGVLEYLRDIT